MTKVFLAFLTALLMALGAAQGRGADGAPRDLDFQVWRDATPMGRHQIAFSQVGDELHVRVAIDLEVTFAFVTLFRYSHRNHEVWRDGRLVSIETATDDDGEAYWLKGRASEVGFQIESSSGRSLVPATIIPTSYWHPDTVKRTQLLDSQHGRLVSVLAESVNPELGLTGNATRYAVRGDLDLDLWYDGTGRLAKIAFEARGSEIDYVLQESDTLLVTD